MRKTRKLQKTRKDKRVRNIKKRKTIKRNYKGGVPRRSSSRPTPYPISPKERPPSRPLSSRPKLKNDDIYARAAKELIKREKEKQEKRDIKKKEQGELTIKTVNSNVNKLTQNLIDHLKQSEQSEQGSSSLQSSQGSSSSSYEVILNDMEHDPFTYKGEKQWVINTLHNVMKLHPKQFGQIMKSSSVVKILEQDERFKANPSAETVPLWICHPTSNVYQLIVTLSNKIIYEASLPIPDKIYYQSYIVNLQDINKKKANELVFSLLNTAPVKTMTRCAFFEQIIEKIVTDPKITNPQYGLDKDKVYQFAKQIISILIVGTFAEEKGNPYDLTDYDLYHLFDDDNMAFNKIVAKVKKEIDNIKDYNEFIDQTLEEIQEAEKQAEKQAQLQAQLQAEVELEKLEELPIPLPDVDMVTDLFNSFSICRN